MQPCLDGPAGQQANVEFSGLSKLKCVAVVFQSRDVVPYQMGEFIRRYVFATISINVVTPPRREQSALLQEFSFVNVSSAYAVTLPVVHLPFNGRVRPQP
ncbi:hypothetical protein D3C77_395040 [compost metagenome]